MARSFKIAVIEAASRAIKRSVRDLLAGNGPRTPDLGGTAKTDQVGRAIVELINA